MSQLLLQALLFERYGPRLNVDQLADALGSKVGTIANQISSGAFPIPTYRDGKKRYADCRDVAEHFERMRELARTSGNYQP